MFDNRINFGQVLRPFPNYEMDYAVGTTYSLSLEALMFIPVTLFFGEELNLSEKVLTSEMFEALTKVPEQVRLFCQRGKMQKPSFYHNILAFWERSVEQVHMDSHMKSFHPKIWLVRYISADKAAPVRYKFICSSRNLTLCRDWDMAVHLEGKVGKQKHAANRPLLEFVKMLNAEAVRKIKPEVLDEIMHIAFELTDDQLSYSFYPIGFNGKSHPLLSGDAKNNELLVISPFLDKQTIEAHRSCSKYFYLLSNAHELDKIDAACLDQLENVMMFHPLLDQPFLSEPSATEGDEATDKNINGTLEPESEYNPSMNLHAKLYITQNGKDASWWIGSANCSAPATRRNIEFLTAINFVRGKATIDEAWVPLVTPAKGQGLFVEYVSGQSVETLEEKKLEADLRELIYNLASLHITGTADKRDDGRFDMAITIETVPFHFPAGWKVSLIPLSANTSAEQEINATGSLQRFLFQDFEESQLTPYLLCTIQYAPGLKKQLVLDCEIEFNDSRMRKVFTSIINNKDKLFKYLSAILSKGEALPLGKLNEQNEGSATPKPIHQLEVLPLYEKLLLAASRDKKKISMVAKTIDFLQNENDEKGQPIVEEKFTEFFNVFKPFADEV